MQTAIQLACRSFIGCRGFWPLAFAALVSSFAPVARLPAQTPRQREPEWEPIGPAPFVTNLLPDQPPIHERYSGRVQTLVADPNDRDVIFIGATGGGVWKTINGGENWTPLTDDQISLNIASIALLKDTLYASTMEVNPGSAVGILKSTDRGQSWKLLGTETFFRHSILRVVIDPRDSETLYAAVGELLTFGISGGKGVWKSTDGGITWTLTTAGIMDEDVSVTDLVIDPADPDRLYAAVGELTGSSDQNGVYRTANGGRSWEFAGDFPLGDFRGTKTAIKLAIAPSKTETLFAVIAGRPDPIGGTSPFAIYKTIDGGETWRPTPLPAEIRGNAYTSTVAVDPLDDSVVYVCNEKRDWSMMLSTDGGQSWADIHHGRNRITPHVDHRGIGFDADLNLLDGDDGGLFRYDRHRAIWADLNTDQQTSFFLSIAQHPTEPETVYGGGFDNGANRTRRSHPRVWDGLRPGDLTTVRLDPINPDIVYSQLGGVSLQRSDDGGRHWVDKVDGIIFTDRTQTPPFVIDARNPKRLVLATDRLYESLNRADSWTAIGTPLPQPVDNIALAPNDDDALYVSAAGSLYATSDRGASWTLGFSGTRSDRFRGIAVSERGEEIAFAVRMGLGHGNVFMTTNGGLDWRDISGNLPNASVNAIAVDPRGLVDILYVALDGGVFVTHDLGQRWTRFGAGLPNASVRALDISTRFNLLVAGTNGRGAWRIGIAAPSN